MNWKKVLLVGVVFCLAGGAFGQTKVKVVGQRVNLRAKAAPESEVVGQVGEGEILPAKSVGDEWVEVATPDKVDVWVHRDFVKDGVVSANKLFVRGGPGINYSVVGTMGRGEAFSVRGEFGEWLKIAPPASSSLWVSRQFVQVVQPEKPRPPEPRPVARPVPAPVPPPVPPVQLPPPVAPPVTAAQEPPPVAPPADLVLIPLEGQGRFVQREGELRMVGFAFSSPSRYRLVRYEGNRTVVICFVRGNNSQLNSFVGQRLLIRGREYWVRGADYPVVIPEQIVPRAGVGQP